MLDADRIRTKSFTNGFRGYDVVEVQAFLGRIALALEVVRDDAASTGRVDVPEGLSPDRIRDQTFTVTWRGYDRREVRVYLDELASEAETALSQFEAQAADVGPLPYVGHRPVTNPILPVTDLAAATDHYTSLGFEVDAWDGGYAWVKHCGHEWFHLRVVESTDGNQASCYLHVADADAWRSAMELSSAGQIEIAPLGEMPWGKREFSVTDPWGNLIRIGSELG